MKIKTEKNIIKLFLLFVLNTLNFIDLIYSDEIDDTTIEFTEMFTMTSLEDISTSQDNLSTEELGTNSQNTFNFTESTQSWTTRPNYCLDLFPKCSCLTSPLTIQCNNFTQFDQLDFTKLSDPQNRKRIYELELNPSVPLVLDNSLNLTGLELYDTVILRNINGFKIDSNPFESVKFNNTLNLFVYKSKIEFYENDNKLIVDDCRLDLIKDDFVPIFSTFDYINFGQELTYPNLCPIIFKNANIRQIEFNKLNQTISFVDLAATNNNSQLNSKILKVRIFDAQNFSLKKSFLNKDVFKFTDTLNFDYVRLAEIEDDTFRNMASLRSLIFVIENMQQFITRSNNTWMKSLNFGFKIDYNQTDLNVQNFYNKSLLVTFNNRNNNQNYLYPTEDLKHFQHFPHENYVFFRILTDLNLNCSKTLEFLLKYSMFYMTPQTLNTTSVSKCFPANQVNVNGTTYGTSIRYTTLNTNRDTTQSKQDTSATSTTSTRSTSSTTKTIETFSSLTTSQEPFTTSTAEYMFSSGAFIGTVVPLAVLLALSTTILIVTLKKFVMIKKILPNNNNEMVSL